MSAPEPPPEPVDTRRGEAARVARPEAEATGAGGPDAGAPAEAGQELELRALEGREDLGGEGLRGALRLAIVLALVVFVADLYLPPDAPVVGLYLLPVLVSLWARSGRATLIAAGVSGVASVVALLVTRGGANWIHAVASESMTLFAIAVTAYLGLMRRGIEDELRKSRETMSTTLASIADGVVTTDLHGRITFMNRAAARVLEWLPEEAAGRDLEAVFRRLSDRREDSGIHSPNSRQEETVIIGRGGQRVSVEVTSAPIRHLEGDLDTPLGRVLVFRDITKRKEEQAKVEELAYRDMLTGLANRASFFDRFELELAHTKRRGGVLGLLYIDLDGFKDVNDQHGHHVGDQLLVQLAERLTSCLRAGDTIARLGGDEFTVLLPDVSSGEGARGVVEKLVQRLSEPYEIEGRQLHSPPSVGLALYPDHGEDMQTLLRAADHSMYRAKGRGGACWSGADELKPQPPPTKQAPKSARR